MGLCDQGWVDRTPLTYHPPPLCFLQKASNTCQWTEKKMGPLETGEIGNHPT